MKISGKVGTFQINKYKDTNGLYFLKCNSLINFKILYYCIILYNYQDIKYQYKIIIVQN